MVGSDGNFLVPSSHIHDYDDPPSTELSHVALPLTVPLPLLLPFVVFLSLCIVQHTFLRDAFPDKFIYNFIQKTILSKVKTFAFAHPSSSTLHSLEISSSRPFLYFGYSFNILEHSCVGIVFLLFALFAILTDHGPPLVDFHELVHSIY